MIKSPKMQKKPHRVNFTKYIKIPLTEIHYKGGNYSL